MKKIISLFQHNHETDRLVRDEVVEGAKPCYNGGMNTSDKQCSKCRRWKAVVEFRADKSRKDGLYLQCRVCESESYHQRYKPKSSRRFVTDAERDEIVRLYQAGATSYQIASQLGISQPPVLQTLHARDIQIRNPHVRRSPIRVDVFDTLTEEAQYWLGFLYADGSIADNRLTLALQIRDKGHLEKYRRFLGVENAITAYQPVAGQTVVRVAVRSQHIVDRLKELGMDKKKPPLFASAEMAESRDFWRGVVDGDGSVLLDRAQRPHLRLNGNYELLAQFAQFCRQFVPTNASPRRHSTIYRVSLAGEYAVRMIGQLYVQGGTALDRKQETANRILQLYK